FARTVKEAAPKNALAALFRHFTDSPAEKMDRLRTTEAKIDQIRAADAELRKWRDFSVLRDKIAAELYRAARVPGSDVPPGLGQERLVTLDPWVGGFVPGGPRREHGAGLVARSARSSPAALRTLFRAILNAQVVNSS